MNQFSKKKKSREKGRVVSLPKVFHPNIKINTLKKFNPTMIKSWNWICPSLIQKYDKMIKSTQYGQVSSSQP